MKKIVLINSILIILVLFVIDIIFYIIPVKEFNLKWKDYNLFYIPHKFTTNHAPLVEGEEFSDKPPIIVAGGSFASSWKIKENETLIYKLAKYAKRKVILTADCEYGPNEALWIFNNDSIYKENKEPDFIIYFFNESHFNLINNALYALNSPIIRPMYNIDKDFNIHEKSNVFNFLFFSHIYKYYYYKTFISDYTKYEETNLIYSIIALNKLIHQHWENTKLIFLRYDEPNVDKPYIFKEKHIKKLEENGIIYLDADKLVLGDSGEKMIGEKYMNEKESPSVYAYELLSKSLAEYLENIN